MPALLYIVLAFGVGLSIGLLLGLRRHLEHELRQQLKDRDCALEKIRQEFSLCNDKRVAAETAKTAADANLTREQERTALAEKKAESLSAEKGRLDHALANANASVNHLNENLLNERKQLETVHTTIQQKFEAISNALLVNSSKTFTEQSSKSLDEILKPLKADLSAFKAKLESTHTEASNQNVLLKDQIARIGTEAANLSKALRGEAKVLGDWAENMLDVILEKSGLQKDVHYRRQQGLKDQDQDGKQRFLDVIVDLPDKKHLIIDSKCSLARYQDHINSVTDADRLEQLEKHVKCIRDHIQDLGKKRYQDLYGINSPDFVLMYIPIEPAFLAAVSHDPGIFAEALEKNVVLITNSTLLATLRTVWSVWRLDIQNKNHQKIARRGGELYDKFCGFIDDMTELDKALKNGRNAWDEAFKKLSQGRGNLIWQVEELKSLGAKASKALPLQLVENASGEAETSVELQPPE